ncbi:ABC-three component system protein [Ligilactobacillus ceti]|uniref:ABC-three component system protein n=1 Tax=Ligilactobacillus ceti TaxID=395085 RepID=UPI000411D977|nr:ABC-three component system protein [Ligilactobacillus ceti]
MDFRTLFRIMKKYISDGSDTPIFCRSVIEMITDLDESDWTNGSDPSQSVSDRTLRNFADRGFSKNLCKKIAYRLTLENLIENINSRPDDVKKALADEFKSYDPSVTKNNVAKKIANWLYNYIKETAGYIDKDALTTKKIKQSSQDYKTKYGNYLLKECRGNCPMKCGKSLAKEINGKLDYVYEISLIEKDKKDGLNNLIALCPQCFSIFQLDDDKTRIKELKLSKKMLSKHFVSEELLDPIHLEKGLTDVLSNLSKLNPMTISVSLDPKEISQKVTDPNLYLLVKNNVTTYFLSIKKIMINLDKQGVIEYEILQNQMRTLYLKMAKTKRSEQEIFYEISNKIHKTTLANKLYCDIVVSYFIQSCEVFNAVTK